MKTADHPISSGDANIQIVKQKLYDFRNHKPATSSHNRHIHKVDISHFRSYFKTRDEQSEQIAWQPKIQSKKLLEDPHFIISLERKRQKIIDSIRKSAFQDMKVRSQYKGSKVKTSNESYKNRSKQTEIWAMHKKNKRQNTIETQQTRKSRKKKSPHINFNFQYMLKNRKMINIINGQSRRMGSNLPYEVFYNSPRSPIRSSLHSFRQFHTIPVNLVKFQNQELKKVILQ